MAIKSESKALDSLIKTAKLQKSTNSLGNHSSQQGFTMAKHIYMTLAALLVLAIAVSAAPAKMNHDVAKDSDFPISRKAAAVQDDDDDEVEEEVVENEDEDAEDDDDDDDDDSSLIRRRREAAKESTAETEAAAGEPEAAAAEGVTAIPSGSAVPTTRKPVLVLIRDALKKVTTGLPTEQVANNALQYFQLFEHFIQQTIEQVIDAADDDEDEVPTATVVPSTNEEEQQQQQQGEENKKPVEATGEAKPEEATVEAKPTEKAPIVPAVEPVESAVASNAV